MESHVRSILKGISWRFLATGTLILIVFLVGGEISTALDVGLKEFIVKLFIYYGHERAWAYYLKNREQTKQVSLFKSISWRVLASLITFIVVKTTLDAEGNGDSTVSAGGVAAIVVGIEVVAKFIIYYLHERAWQLVPAGTFRKIFKKITGAKSK